MEKYPEHQAKIKKALEEDDQLIRGKKEHEMTLQEISIYRAQLEREKAHRVYEKKKIEKVPNLTYEKQKMI